MKIFVLDKYTLTTEKSQKEILRTLKDNAYVGSFSSSHDPNSRFFSGYIFDNGFLLKMKYSKKHPIRPVVQGKIVEDYRKCSVVIRIRLAGANSLAPTFMAIVGMLMILVSSYLIIAERAYQMFWIIGFCALYLAGVFLVSRLLIKRPVQIVKDKIDELIVGCDEE